MHNLLFISMYIKQYLNAYHKYFSTHSRGSLIREHLIILLGTGYKLKNKNVIQLKTNGKIEMI